MWPFLRRFISVITDCLANMAEMHFVAKNIHRLIEGAVCFPAETFGLIK